MVPVGVQSFHLVVYSPVMIFYHDGDFFFIFFFLHISHLKVRLPVVSLMHSKKRSLLLVQNQFTASRTLTVGAIKYTFFICNHKTRFYFVSCKGDQWNKTISWYFRHEDLFSYIHNCISNTFISIFYGTISEVLAQYFLLHVWMLTILLLNPNGIIRNVWRKVYPRSVVNWHPLLKPMLHLISRQCVNYSADPLWLINDILCPDRSSYKPLPRQRLWDPLVTGAVRTSPDIEQDFSNCSPWH